jgi:hypothetical protein
MEKDAHGARRMVILGSCRCMLLRENQQNRGTVGVLRASASRSTQDAQDW